MDLTPVHPVKSKAIVGRKCLRLGIKAILQHLRQFLRGLAADRQHDELEHVVLHRRIADVPPVPDPPSNEDIDVPGDNTQLAQDLRILVATTQRCEEHWVLECERILSVVVNRLEAGSQ